MMHRRWLIILAGFMALCWFGFSSQSKNESIGPETSLTKVLYKLGEAKPEHFIADPSKERIKQGRDLVYRGYTIQENGKKSKMISVHYNCTHCHNQVQETPGLKYNNPEKLLDYAIENELPYLQGTTFYGVVNRESWYNGDYVLKYGELAKEAHHSLKASIQLCASVCSQGRYLKAWELEAILAYLWSKELKLNDLDLNTEDYDRLNQQLNNKSDQDELVKWLQSKYGLRAPATFTDRRTAMDTVDQLTGNAQTGKAIYELGCLYCHQDGGVTEFKLNNERLTFKHLRNNFYRDWPQSIFWAVREGTKPKPGYRPYMPHYTLERMSHQQLADLKAYIESRSEGKGGL